MGGADDMSIHVVIARFRESLAWVPRVLGDARVDVTIYNKSGDHSETAIPVPNVGREAETFARYVVDNYGGWGARPPGAIMFLQGHPFDHVAEEVVHAAARCGGVTEPQALGRIVACDENGLPDHPGLGVGEAHRLLFGKCARGGTWRFCAGAQYIVPAPAVLARPVDFWKRLHALLEREEIDPWCMERLWPAVFCESV